MTKDKHPAADAHREAAKHATRAAHMHHEAADAHEAGEHDDAKGLAQQAAQHGVEAKAAGEAAKAASDLTE